MPNPYISFNIQNDNQVGFNICTFHMKNLASVGLNKLLRHKQQVSGRSGILTRPILPHIHNYDSV